MAGIGNRIGRGTSLRLWEARPSLSAVLPALLFAGALLPAGAAVPFTKVVEDVPGRLVLLFTIPAPVITVVGAAPGVKVTENPGLLAGHYGGATASATVGLGLGGNVLVGGMDGSISLQPLSIEGNTGLNVAAGVAAVDLKFDSVAGIKK